MTSASRDHITLRAGLFGATCIALQPLMLNALSIPVMAYIIRGLGPTAYGQWATSTAIIAACTMLANLGLRGAFVRRVAMNPHAAPMALAEQLGARLILAVLAASVAIGACVLFRYSPVILQCTAVAAVGLIALTVATTFVDLFQSLHRLPTVAAVNLVSGLLLTTASVIVIFMRSGPLWLAIAYLLGPFSSAAIFWCVLRARDFPVLISLDLRRAWQLLRASRSFAVQQVITTAGAHGHALLLSRIVSPASFAFFSAGCLLPNRLSVIPDGLCTAAYPALARRYLQSPGEAAKLVARYVAIVLLACVATAVAVTLVARPIAQLLFPQHWAICFRVILITIWIVPFAGLEWIMGTSLNAAGKDAAHARAAFPAGLCALLVSLLLVVRFDIVGACWASIVPSAAKALFLAPSFARTFGTPWRDLARSEPSAALG